MKPSSLSPRGRLLLTLTNELSELETICRRLEEFRLALKLPPRVIAQINLVIEEVFTNIVSYGCSQTGRHMIRICIFVCRNTLVMRIEDDGLPFNPVHSPAPDCRCPVEQRPIGRLGIHLVKMVMDKMVYKRKGDRNILILVKRYDSLQCGLG